MDLDEYYTNIGVSVGFADPHRPLDFNQFEYRVQREDMRLSQYQENLENILGLPSLYETKEY